MWRPPVTHAVPELSSRCFPTPTHHDAKQSIQLVFVVSLFPSRFSDPHYLKSRSPPKTSEPWQDTPFCTLPKQTLHCTCPRNRVLPSSCLHWSFFVHALSLSSSETVEFHRWDGGVSFSEELDERTHSWLFDSEESDQWILGLTSLPYTLRSLDRNKTIFKTGKMRGVSSDI